MTRESTPLSNPLLAGAVFLIAATIVPTRILAARRRRALTAVGGTSGDAPEARTS